MRESGYIKCQLEIRGRTCVGAIRAIVNVIFLRGVSAFFCPVFAINISILLITTKRDQINNGKNEKENKAHI